MPSNEGQRSRPHWRGLLFSLALTVGGGHVLIFAMGRLGGEASPSDFSLTGFALVWGVAAAGASVQEWWHRRSARRAEPPRKRWRDGTPRWLTWTSPVLTVVWFATTLSAYLAALDGEIPLIWADALAAFAFALAATAPILAEPRTVTEDAELP